MSWPPGWLFSAGDGEVYFASVADSSPRQQVIDAVGKWFERGVKAKTRATYRLEDGVPRRQVTVDPRDDLRNRDLMFGGRTKPWGKSLG